MNGYKAVFLDRDGTINVEVDFLRRWQDVELLPQVAAALKILRQAGYKLVVISNQSGLARGIFDESDLAGVQLEIKRKLADEGAAVDGTYFCPHHPCEGVVEDLVRVCACRKPEPGLILMAAEEMGLSLPGSFMVGDRKRDIACGQRAGLKTVLVTTGRHEDDGAVPDWPEQPDYIAADLLQAAQWILRNQY